MKLARTLAAIAIAGLFQTGASADTRNVITRIDSGQDARGAFLKIVGSRAPSFTQYRLEAPARVVIDLGDAVLAGPPAELPLHTEVLRSVRTLMYEARGVSFTRVVLETGDDVPYTIDTQGSELFVRLEGQSLGRQLARKSTEDAVEAARRARAAETRLAEAAARVDQLQQEAEQWREQAARSSVALNEAKQAAASTEARAAEEARAVKAAQAELARRDADLAAAMNDLGALRSKAADAEAKARDAEAKARDAEAALASTRNEVRSDLDTAVHERDIALARAEAARQRLDETDRTLKDAHQRVDSLQAQLDQMRATAERSAAEQLRAREEAEALARREAAARAELETQLAKLRAEGRLAADARAAVPAGRQVAWAQYETGEEAGGDAPGARVDNRPKVMSYVGFQQRPDVSRVYVRTNEPARYTVTQQGDEIWLEIENTRASTLNDLNHLDTRFFDTAVAMIDPEEIEGAGTHIRVRIRLKQNVPYEATRTDNEIRIDFRRPGQ
ncbi:MAG: AMIN domain-containing protein [Deltaproteobacteria bacterium]|nr:AMIN domain-containing protein [Deltaproteobacteria bacterium]